MPSTERQKERLYLVATFYKLSSMAWRIADYIERGEIDNRVKGGVTGQLWFSGRKDPIRLELTGNAWADLAGHSLHFDNPEPKPMPGHLSSFAAEQTGVVGDITAARKVKVLDFPIEELEKYYKTGIPMPYHWGNSLYLEWYSVRNGRVVVEATSYQLRVGTEATWKLSEAEESDQQSANARAMIDFTNQLVDATEKSELSDPDDVDDTPQSRAEAEADAESARMDLLLDRVSARLEREGNDSVQFERILKEERARLRRERGEPDPEPLSSEQAAEFNEWFEATNAEAPEVTGTKDASDEHPLVEHCHRLGSRLQEAIKRNGWLPENALEEHPLHELVHGVWFATAKLAGALNGGLEDWPPDSLIAGDTLVRLKKARSYFKDALRALDSADAEKLTDAQWLPPVRQELQGILQTVESLIDEVRGVLGRTEEG